MTIRNFFLTISTFLLFLYIPSGMAEDQKLDLSTIIKEDNPRGALSFAKTLKHSSAKYGETEVDTYYNFDSPTFTLLGFKLESCTISMFDKAIGHIYCHFLDDENNERLETLLTQSLGKVNLIKEADETIKRWLGKNEFYYELRYTDYDKNYVLSITDDIYRKFNKVHNGG